MRRGISIAVLAVVVAALVAPLALAAPGALPACCRVGGQHHCAGMNGPDGFHSAPSSCPYRATPAIPGRVASLIRGSLQFSLTAQESRIFVTDRNNSILEAFSDIHKRGPPVS